MLRKLINQLENKEITVEEFNKKFTRRVFFETVIEESQNQYVIDKAKIELEKLDKSQQKAKERQGKTSEENLALIEIIENELKFKLSKYFLASEVAEMLDISTQKASALLRKMVALGKAVQKDGASKSKPKLYKVISGDEEVSEVEEDNQ